MKRFILLSFLALFCLFSQSNIAHADAEPLLRGSLLTTSGRDPVEFGLDAQSTREFWRRWRTLKPTTSLVPAPDNGAYRGLELRDTSGTLIRIFSGVVQMNSDYRADDGRLLERFVLTLAPPPLGPTLARSIDQTGGAKIGSLSGQEKPTRLSAKAIIAKCRGIAGERWDLRAACLENTMAQSLKPEVYGPALEKLIASLSHELPQDASDIPDPLKPKVASPKPPQPPSAKAPARPTRTDEPSEEPAASENTSSPPATGHTMQIPISDLEKLYGAALQKKE